MEVNVLLMVLGSMVAMVVGQTIYGLARPEATGVEGRRRAALLSAVFGAWVALAIAPTGAAYLWNEHRATERCEAQGATFEGWNDPRLAPVRANPFPNVAYCERPDGRVTTAEVPLISSSRAIDVGARLTLTLLWIAARVC